MPLHSVSCFLLGRLSGVAGLRLEELNDLKKFEVRWSYRFHNRNTTQKRLTIEFNGKIRHGSWCWAVQNTGFCFKNTENDWRRWRGEWECGSRLIFIENETESQWDLDRSVCWSPCSEEADLDDAVGGVATHWARDFDELLSASPEGGLATPRFTFGAGDLLWVLLESALLELEFSPIDEHYSLRRRIVQIHGRGCLG